MNTVKHFDAAEFLKDELINLKGEKKVFVVFSTFGTREAELIYEKISLVKNKLGDYVDKIFLSHRREGDVEDLTETRAREADSNAEIIICNTLKVPDMGREKGKGADMRRALYHINKNHKGNSSDDEIIMVFLDADVVSKYFGTQFVTGLSGAVLKGYDFAKASFWREMGRVKKFVAQPLFSVIDHPDLDNLKNLAYPLSGEVAGTVKFFNTVNFWQIYGVETGINIDSSVMKIKTADVNLGLYDHEHHADLNIQKMAFGIIRTYLIQLRDYGFIEFKKNSTISNNFKAQLVNDAGERESLDFDLAEKKYKPLCGLIKK